ncbi:MAG: ABC transporter substrate-binding protein [Betaproteobacteria bacterium]
MTRISGRAGLPRRVERETVCRSTRRKVLIALGASALTLPLAAFAQRLRKVWRIGFLSRGPHPPDGAPPAALRRSLAELGYVEGRNVVYEGRWAEAKGGRDRELAADLVRLGVDAIVVSGSATAVKEATSTIPIIIAGSGDPVGAGVVASLARPGGNITGTSAQATELSSKRLEILMEAVPTAARIAVLYNADNPSMILRYREIDKAARTLRVTVQSFGVREPEEFDAAFAAMIRERPDALVMVSDALTSLNRKRVIEFSWIHRIPAMYEFDSLVLEGGLMAYGPSFDDIYRRAAIYVDKILKGAKPGDLPVEQLDRFYLTINLRTARVLGLTIPQSVLLRADRVIE